MKSGPGFIALFLLFLPLIAFGQGNITALESSLQSAEGTARADILVQLVDLLKEAAPEKASDYAEEAFKISKKEDYYPGILKSAFVVGVYHLNKKNYRKARLATEKGIEAAQVLNDQEAELEGWKTMQTIYQFLGNGNKLEEAKLEHKRIKNSLDLQKSTEQLSDLKNTVESKEEALQESEEENRKIQAELEETQEEMLLDEAERTQLAIEKAQLAQEKAELAQEKAELEVEVLQTEKEITAYNNRLKRQRNIQTLLMAGIIIAFIFAFIVLQYFRLKRLREAEKAKAQRQLIMQEKMATLGQLTAGIAHEIRNPLNFVNNFAESSTEMARELEETLSNYQKTADKEELNLAQELASDLRQNASDIAANGHRISRIVYSMMEHARGNKGKIEEVNINELIRRNLNLAYHGYRGLHPDFTATIKEYYDYSLKPIEVIAQDIDRVFLNLFGNACYALHQKQSQADYTPTITVTTKGQDREVLILIQDNGIGIPQSLQKQIFTPFFTTKPAEEGHTGLGLSISYDLIVQGHHGKLDVSSEPGEYTEFSIVLPA